MSSQSSEPKASISANAQSSVPLGLDRLDAAREQPGQLGIDRETRREPARRFSVICRSVSYATPVSTGSNE